LEVDNVVTFRLAPYMVGYAPERSRALFEQIESAMKARPGVSGVTASRIPLLAGAASGREVQVQGFVAGPDTDRTSRYNVIGTEFFRTLGIAVIAGRDFTVSDALGSPKVAIVNEAFVQKFQLGPDAIGTRMSSDGSDTIDTEIVGIVANTKYAGVRNEMPPQFYLPYRQDDLVGMLTFYVRTSADPASLVGAVPGLVRAIDANVPAAFAKTMPEQVQDNVFLDRGVSVLASMFATLATILAAVGLYGVLAYTVTQRTREIGVRMALGADRGRVRGMVLSQVGWMTLAGGTLGIVAAIGVTRLGRSMLHEMQPYDPGVILFSVIVLSAVSLAAGFLPAHRASRVDPIKALRYE
jgi:predicted permease